MDVATDRFQEKQFENLFSCLSNQCILPLWYDLAGAIYRIKSVRYFPAFEITITKQYCLRAQNDKALLHAFSCAL